MSVIFERVEYLCGLNNITVNALENIAGINHGTVQKWRNKEDVMPSSATLLILADYFNVSLDYLLGRCDNPISHKSPDDLASAIIEIEKRIKQFGSTSQQFQEDVRAILDAKGIKTQFASPDTPENSGVE